MDIKQDVGGLERVLGPSSNITTERKVDSDGRETYIVVADHDVVGSYEARIAELEAKLAQAESREKQLEQRTQALQSEVYLDVLVDAQNRKYWNEVVPENIESNDKPYAILFLDGDQFKEINDRYGHAKGDEVLKSTAKALRSYIRDDDDLIRMGGDEFVAILYDVNEKLDTDNRLRRLNGYVNRFVVDETGVDFTVSMGAAVVYDNDMSLSEALSRADENMYSVKQAGRNSCNIIYMDQKRQRIAS